MPVTNPPKSARITVRATPEEKRLLQDTARDSHKSVSKFLLHAGIEAAIPLRADQLRFTLPPNEWRGILVVGVHESADRAGQFFSAVEAGPA